MKHLSIKVSGKVQGVFFRASTQHAADELGIKGFVKNELDGSVYIEAEGPEEKLGEFIEWCKKGPERAHVITVDVKENVLKNYSRFEISR